MDSNWINAGGIIPSGWELVPLKDLLLNDKAISVGVMYPGEHLDGGIPLIKVGDVTNGEILKEPDSRISPIVDEEYKRTRLVGNELLITLVGNPGECVIVEPHMKGWNAARALAVLRFKNPEIRHWLKLIIQSKPSRHIIDSRLNTTVQKTLNLKDVKELPVLMPSEKIRNSLCCYYYTLEHKSTLNRQINQTLEQMAQALFKSWFVDFDPVIDNALDAGFFAQDLDLPNELLRRAEIRQAVRNRPDFKPLADATRQLFPAAFEECAEPSLGLGGWIPKGWMEKKISELVDTISKTYPLKTVDEVIFLNTGDIENGHFLHANYSKVDGLPGQAKKTIQKDDILFSEIRPKNKRFAFVGFDAHSYVVSTKLMVLRAKECIHPLFAYFLLTLDETTNELQRIAELRSGTFPQITFSELSLIKFVLITIETQPASTGVVALEPFDSRS